MGHEVFKPLLEDSVLYCRQCATMNKEYKTRKGIRLTTANESSA